MKIRFQFSLRGLLGAMAYSGAAAWLLDTAMSCKDVHPQVLELLAVLVVCGAGVGSLFGRPVKGAAMVIAGITASVVIGTTLMLLYAGAFWLLVWLGLVDVVV